MAKDYKEHYNKTDKSRSAYEKQLDNKEKKNKLKQLKDTISKNPKVRQFLAKKKVKDFLESPFCEAIKKFFNWWYTLPARLKEKRDRMYDIGENDAIPGFVKNNKNYILFGCSIMATMVLTISVLAFIPNHRCQFEEWHVSKSASCTELGIVQRTCTCGNVQTAYLEMVDHEFGDYYLAQESDCYNFGILEAICNNCNTTITKPNGYIKHTYPDWTVDRPMTCLQNGSRHRYCTVCKQYVREEIFTTGHNYHSINIAPTAGKDGYTLYTCMSCNYVYTDNIRHALGSEGLLYELIEEEKGTFYEVVGLGTCRDEHVYIPSQYQGIPVKSIGENAFANSKTVKTLTIPDTILKVGANVFYNSNIETVHYGSVYSSINNEFFANSNVKKVVFTNTIVPSFILSHALSVETVILSNSVQTIMSNAFSESGLKHIEYGNGLKQVGAEAFNGCKNLTMLKWPSVSNISTGALNMCVGLETLYLSSDTKTFELSALRNCVALNTIYFDGNMHTWQNIAKSTGWDYNTNSFQIVCSDGTIYKDGTLESKLDALFQWSFNAATQTYTLEKFLGTSDDMVVVPKKYKGLPIDSIADDAFKDAKLTNLVILADIISIGSSAFENCSNLVSIVLPDTIQTIRERAFVNCTSLQDITMPSMLDFYFDGMFEGCDKLILKQYDNGFYLSSYNNDYYILVKTVNNKIDTFEFHEDTRFMDAVFKNHQRLTSIILPNNLTYLPQECFINCYRLTSVVMNDDLIKTGSNIFKNCNMLESIVFSENLEAIENGSFENCISLKNIPIPNSVKSIGKKAFANCKNININGNSYQNQSEGPAQE